RARGQDPLGRHHGEPAARGPARTGAGRPRGCGGGRGQGAPPDRAEHRLASPRRDRRRAARGAGSGQKRKARRGRLLTRARCPPAGRETAKLGPGPYPTWSGSRSEGWLPMAASPWAVIHAERDALAADLTDIEPAQWDTPSMCTQWTVRQALGHMTATAKMTPPQFFMSMAKAGFNFGKMS